MSHTEPQSRVAEQPCPKCGCYIVKLFDCNCGSVHSDYCVNCGRFTSLPRDEHIELSIWDGRCRHGAVMHDHPWLEKEARMDAAQKAIDEEVRRSGAKSVQEVRDVIERVSRRPLN